MKRPKTPRGIEPRPHKGGWTFRVRYKDAATGRRHGEEFSTVQEAEDFQAVLRLARRSGALSDLQRGRVLLADFVEQQWAGYAANSLAVATGKAYETTYNLHLLPHIGHLQLRELTPPNIHQLAEELQKAGVGKPTVRKALAVLQSICAYAVQRGELSANPVREVRKPPAKRTSVIRPFSIEEVEALLVELRARSSDPAHWMLAELIAYSGARPQDALALGYTRVGAQRLVYDHKNEDGQIVAGAKTGPEKARSVALLAHLRSDLLHFRAESKGNPRGLVIARPDGEPWRSYDYKNWQHRESTKRDPVTQELKVMRRAGPFAAAAEAIGRPDATPYFLRHTFASIRLAEQRLSLQEIATEMGHTVEVLARTYSHIISEYQGAGALDPDRQIKAIREGATPQERPKSVGHA